MIWTGREETSWGFRAPEEVAQGLKTVRKLGGGGEFEVYLVEEMRSGDAAVAKLVRPHLVDESHPVAGLRREAGVLEQLEHPGIVKLLRSDLAPPRPHLVLEYCDGSSLADLVRAGPLETDDALELCAAVAAALAHLHEKGFVHLDVKPGNVIVGEPVRLIDLGMARPVEDAAKLMSPAGTDAFMAPEQCAPGDGAVGPAADVWGLGATLSFALTGKRPFPRDPAGGTGPAWRRPQSTRPFVPAEELGPEVTRTLQALLAQHPGDRPRSGEISGLLRAAG